MPWVKLDDTFPEHHKVERAGWQAAWMFVAGLCYTARSRQEGFIPANRVARLTDAKSPQKLAAKLVEVGLWEAVEGGYKVHDYLVYNPSIQDIEERKGRTQRRVSLHRDLPLRTRIRERDGDRCRYCGHTVKWTDRRGPLGGTYDHVDPDGPNTMENLVVACRGCNSSKGSRTPAEANLDLLPVSKSDLGTDLEQNPKTDLSPYARGGRDGQINTSSQGGDEVDARMLITAACVILDAIPAWEPNEMGVENAHAMYPTIDLLQGCRLAVTWASDPSWEIGSCTATLRAALRKLDADGKPKPATARESEREQRRARGAAALQALGGQA